jgi:HK97 family phage prohead protease
MSIASFVPDVSTLHPALNGDGLLLEGYASTPTLDRHNDVVRPGALTRTIARFMATNPVLMFAHKYGLPPIGRVLEARVEPKGLFIKAVMPRPEPGTFASEVWNAAKEGLMRALSLGATWTRKDRGSYREIIDADCREISLCPISVGFDTVASAIVPTEAKALGGEWLSVAEYAQRQSEARAWLALKLAERKLNLAALKLDVLAMRSC